MHHKSRKISVVCFYDKEGSVIMQKRGMHSKAGEKYGFFGGGIKKGETPLQALKRELSEEIGFVPQKLTKFLEYGFKFYDKNTNTSWKIEVTAFISPISNKLLKANIIEGSGLYKIKIEEALNSSDFDFYDKDLLAEVEKSLTLFQYL